MSDRFSRLLRSLLAGLLLAVLARFFPFAAGSELLPERLVRLHVLAHSDSAPDQALKLKVRDAVLTEASRWTATAPDAAAASDALCLHLGAIQSAADAVLAREGSSQTAAVTVTDDWFPIREYADFTLPAGRYRTLKVTLGAGEGHNWWCVVFPALCLPAARDRDDPLALWPEALRDQAGDPDAPAVTVKFKLAQWWEDLRRGFQGG